MKTKIFSIGGIIFFLSILFICLSTTPIHSKPRQGPPPQRNRPSSGISYIDGHNHLHGFFRVRGVEEVDFIGAAKLTLSSMEKYGITN